MYDIPTRNGGTLRFAVMPPYLQKLGKSRQEFERSRGWELARATLRRMKETCDRNQQPVIGHVHSVQGRGLLAADRARVGSGGIAARDRLFLQLQSHAAARRRDPGEPSRAKRSSPRFLRRSRNPVPRSDARPGTKRSGRPRGLLSPTTPTGMPPDTKSPPRSWQSFSRNREHSRHLRLLSRQRRLPGARWNHPRRRAGGTLHEKKARRRIPETRHRLLPARSRVIGRPTTRSRRLLREAIPEVRPAAFHLPGLRAARAALVPQGHAGLDEAKDLAQGHHSPGARI